MTRRAIAFWGALALSSVAAAAEDLACPDGTADSEVTDTDGTELWCARPDGTRHGPFQKRDPSGRITERGYFEEGLRAGHWRYYDAKGHIVRTGQMSANRPDGAWTHFDPGGEASATITHGRFPPAEYAPPQPADPRHRWQLSLPASPTAWWAAPPDRLVVAVGTTRLLVVSLQTGAIDADIPLPAPLRPGLRIEGDRILGVTGPGELFVVELDADGGGTWQRVRTPVGVTDAIASGPDGAVWVRNGRGRITGIDLDTGSETWSGRLFMDELAPVAVDKRVIGLRDAREVRAITAGDGQFAWQARMPARVVALSGSPATVLALLETGEVQALDSASGAPLWSARVDLVPGVQPTMQADATATWITTPHDAWRLDTVRGVVLDHRSAQPPEGQSAADFSVGSRRACTTGRQGGIRCLPGDWELDTEAPVLPALVTDGAVIVAGMSGTVRALEPALARAIEQVGLEDDGILVDDTLAAEVDWRGDRFALDVPYMVVERPRPGDDCTVTTAAVQLPHPDTLWPPAELDDDTEDAAPVPDDAVALWLDDVVLQDDLGEGTFRVHEDWEETPLWTTWRMSYWHRHVPTLGELHVTLDDTTDPAEIDALVRCEGPPARFRGTALLDDGLRGFRMTGNLEVHPSPHSLDGVPGCLLDVSMAGTDYGSWSSPVLPAWSEVVVEVSGDTLPEYLPVDVDVPQQLTGSIWLDAYPPGATARTDLIVDGTVDLRIDPGDQRGPVLRAYHGPSLLFEVPVPDLVYGAVEEAPDGALVPVPTVEEHLELARLLPFDTAADAWRVVWTRSSCTADLAPAVAADPVDTPETRPGQPSPVARPPMVRPKPMAPPPSRWRRKRTVKPPRDERPKP